MAHSRKLLDIQEKKKKLTDCKKQDYQSMANVQPKINLQSDFKTLQSDTKSFVGSTGLSFNDRYTKHECSFKHEKYGNAKALFSGT